MHTSDPPGILDSSEYDVVKAYGVSYDTANVIGAELDLLYCSYISPTKYNLTPQSKEDKVHSSINQSTKRMTTIRILLLLVLFTSLLRNYILMTYP